MEPLSLDDIIQKKSTIEEIATKNYSDLSNNQIYKHLIRYPIDRYLSDRFGIIGYGTTALVFNACDFVIKRVVDNDNSWEIPYFIRANQIPGLYAERYEIDFPKCIPNDGSIQLYIQERLIPIDPNDYKSLIHRLYFKDTSYNQFNVISLGWEWGLDQEGIPRVFDWG